MNKPEALGNVRLRHAETNEIVLIPTPSTDPNDPLNWSKAYRHYLAGLVCLAIFFTNFLAGGPSVAIVPITTTFFGPPGPDLAGNISKVSYFFTCTALLQGMGNLFWVPCTIKFGRRPVYVASFTLYTACAAWAGGATSYSSELAARIIMGFASGAGETLAPLTISDIFFLHERGTIMALYTCALSAGVAGGIVLAGLITINLNWRYIYWVSVALIGASTVLVIFTFPETEFPRTTTMADIGDPDTSIKKRSWAQGLSLMPGNYTQESWFKLFIRPIILLALPPVLWATLVMAVTIGFLVAISSNFATAFETAYNFEPWQSGLCFISGIIGSLIAIFFGGHMSDMIADFLTKRNGGIREPEMRLPALIISTITAPLALVLYGVGIGANLHWIAATIGLGLLNFSIVQATNVSLVYTIDAYRPIAGEITVTQLGFKSAFGFLLSFYTNPWIAQSGYERSFGAMAGISGAVILGWIPLYFFGSAIRQVTWRWGFVKRLAHWHEDREVGE
ncbi:MFS general substrate transporter [Zopfia rhizophila CBS 207.26]|uniref:MFS general substrate transporter n=1 Tax=Zopfia rhizophila CBS 207.26 TaxID=1314779 RepID=A0A6A6EWA5_9PEZI|nr:MFS general substrate transporter [Zopfia rhizophila CBS 207.26]